MARICAGAARRRAGLALFPCLLFSGAPATTAFLPAGGARWTTSRACTRRLPRQPTVWMEHAPSDSFVSAARTAGIAAAIFFFVRSLVVEPYFIPSSSMAPTLSRNDHIAVEKFSKYLSPPHRGDMLVFTPPAAFFENGGKAEADETVVLVKRVIGIPGDVVEVREGVMLLNGEPRYEPHHAAGVTWRRGHEDDSRAASARLATLKARGAPPRRTREQRGPPTGSGGGTLAHPSPPPPRRRSGAIALRCAHAASLAPNIAGTPPLHGRYLSEETRYSLPPAASRVAHWWAQGLAPAQRPRRVPLCATDAFAELGAGVTGASPSALAPSVVPCPHTSRQRPSARARGPRAHTVPTAAGLGAQQRGLRPRG